MTEATPFLRNTILLFYAPCRLGGGSFAYGIADGKSIWFFCLYLGQLKHLADVDEVVILNDAAVQLIDLVPAAAAAKQIAAVVAGIIVPYRILQRQCFFPYRVLGIS